MIEKKRAQQKDGFFSGSKSLLENQLWEAIHENIISGYVSELAWIERVRKQVLPLAKSSMNQQEPQLRYQKVIDGSQIIVKSDPSSQLTSEKDGVTLVGFCAESDSNLILIPRACLTERFYDLSTGVAGEILQKLTNYGIRAAIVSDRTEATGEWKQFITEINRGNAFHVCADEKQALEWLSKGGEKQ